MEELIHMTATYSNALLVAILPHVSDFSQKLELPIPQPITERQVQEFKPSPFKGYVAGAVTLKNGHRFSFANGYIGAYQSYSNGCYIPEDWTPENYHRVTNFFGTMRMTTNDVVDLARESLRKLGYDLTSLHADRPPTGFKGPLTIDRFGGGIIPCCEVEWRSKGIPDKIRVSINAETMQVLGFSLPSSNAVRPDPKIDVMPELESEHRRKTQTPIFIRTNAPSRLAPSPQERR